MAAACAGEKVVRIGGATASFSDTALSTGQLLGSGGLDYLIFDYLAEGSMAIFGRMQAGDPALGYGTDFLTVHVGPYLRQIADQRVKVIANAGGVNPAGLAAALEQMIAEQGLALRVATVEGDDLRGELEALRASGVRDMFTHAPFPDKIISANAYLGAFPIAAALGEGADIVVTGRVVDSALALGALIHEFGWGADDLDLLAGGTLAGHLLECGAQITGGTFTDWRDVPDWANIGYPIGECHADGSVVITKPPGTGGLVSVGTVAEQLLYEVSDPGDYIVADVRCDFTGVTLEEAGPDRVRVSGAKGRAPTDSYKVCITFEDGWRAIAYQPIIGEDAPAKAERQAEAVFDRARQLLRARNLADFSLTDTVLIGAEASYGERSRAAATREVICKLVVDHPAQEGAGLFAREQWAGISGMSVGTSINLATTVMPKTGLFLCLLPKDKLTASYTFGGKRCNVPIAAGTAAVSAPPAQFQFDPVAVDPAWPTLDLVELAWARSGDKGHLFNVAVIARRPEYLPFLDAALTCDAIAAWYQHFGSDNAPVRAERFAVPGFHAINFLVHNALSGGINASTQLDPAAKGMAQLLLRFAVPVPPEIHQQIRR
jgi:hypothetical protein